MLNHSDERKIPPLDLSSRAVSGLPSSYSPISTSDCSQAFSERAGHLQNPYLAMGSMADSTRLVSTWKDELLEETSSYSNRQLLFSGGLSALAAAAMGTGALPMLATVLVTDFTAGVPVVTVHLGSLGCGTVLAFCCAMAVTLATRRIAAFFLRREQGQKVQDESEIASESPISEHSAG